MKFTLPLRLVSSLNAREHWAARARRVKRERVTAFLAVPKVPVPCTVYITRIGKRRMDGDNLQGACKAIRDGIAQKLGVDDGDSRIRWEYAQEIGKEYGVRIRIEYGEGSEGR